MKLAVLMDPMDKINPKKDTTLAMIKAAEAMQWSITPFTLNDLYCDKGQPFAASTPLKDFNIILMRKDPPFDLEYIYATYALELAEKQGVLIANKPQSLRDANEKFFTLNFPQCCPPTRVSRDATRLKAFWEEHRNVIFKPLEGMGGRAVFHVDEDGRNLSVILEVLTAGETVTVMAQKYIPEISTQGDKRIILINGEPVRYALSRIPLPGGRGNLVAGAKGEVTEITERDRWICSQLAPTLQEKGLYFAGIDVIGEYLTEINVTSPTCVKEIEAETGLDIAGDYLRFLANRALLPAGEKGRG